MKWNDYSKIKPNPEDVGKKNFIIYDGGIVMMAEWINSNKNNDNNFSDGEADYCFAIDYRYNVKEIEYWIGPVEFDDE